LPPLQGSVTSTPLGFQVSLVEVSPSLFLEIVPGPGKIFPLAALSPPLVWLSQGPRPPHKSPFVELREQCKASPGPTFLPSPVDRNPYLSAGVSSPPVPCQSLSCVTFEQGPFHPGLCPPAEDSFFVVRVVKVRPASAPGARSC